MDESLAGEWGGDHGVARARTGSAEVRGSCLILHGAAPHIGNAGGRLAKSSGVAI